MDWMTAERIGRNDSAFRDANEQISAKAKELRTADDRLIPFICECADEECTSIIQLNLAEYEDVRNGFAPAPERHRTRTRRGPN
jgi:hypothetical protein